MTSHDAVAILRRRFGTKRVGHSGTLDPLATGLLVIAVGPATRFLQFLPLEPKVYCAQVEFGRATTTFDAEGESTSEAEVPADLAAKLAEIVPNFLGEQEQLPPMYSAVKVKGKPLYEYARQGEDIERKKRKIQIHQLVVNKVEGNTAEILIECSGGTYVRTIADDLGKALGCGAFLSGLVRTQVGSFLLENAVDPKEGDLSGLIPLKEALQPMEMRQLTPLEFARVQNGNPVVGSQAEGELIGLLTPEGDLLSVAEADGTMLHPLCVIPSEALHKE